MAASTLVRARGGTSVAEPAARTKKRLAPRYKVLMHDDPVTTMEFVVDLLKDVFKKSQADAHSLMMEVHTGGVALIEVVPLETAEHHVERSKSLARGRGYPLALTIESAD